MDDQPAIHSELPGQSLHDWLTMYPGDGDGARVAKFITEHGLGGVSLVDRQTRAGLREIMDGIDQRTDLWDNIGSFHEPGLISRFASAAASGGCTHELAAEVVRVLAVCHDFAEITQTCAEGQDGERWQTLRLMADFLQAVLKSPPTQSAGGATAQ
jgi:hypothetical protein